MKLRKSVVAIGTILVLACIVAWNLRRERQLDREQARVLAGVQSTLEEISNRIEETSIAALVASRQVSALDARIAASEHGAHLERTDMLQGRDAEGQENQEIEPNSVIGADELHAELDDIFSSETAGPWNQDARQDLITKLEPILSEDTAVRSLECRRSLCRMELHHASMDDYHEFMQKALLSETRITMGGAFSTPTGEADGDGRVSAVTYLALGSEPLPRIGLGH
jgi:hypothetical protein